MAINNTGNTTNTTATTVGNQAFSSCINSKIALFANAGTSIMSANTKRSYAVLVNTSDVPITLVLGDNNTPSFGQGIMLTARGSSYEITAINLFVGRVLAIAQDSASLSFVECSFV